MMLGIRKIGFRIKMATIRDHSKKVKLVPKKKTFISFKSKGHEELEVLIKELKIQRIVLNEKVMEKK